MIQLSKQVKEFEQNLQHAFLNKVQDQKTGEIKINYGKVYAIYISFTSQLANIYVPDQTHQG